MQPDILVFMSDQHSALCCGYAGDPIVRTPNLDKLAAEGVAFDNAYTSCPLCVPARVSMLTGQLPVHTGVYDNNGAINEDQATFMHSLTVAGYETVLCGRMHFIGDDQRHGFTKRIMGDFSPTTWGRDALQREDMGDFCGTHFVGQCLKIVGPGTSPVIEYDKAVIQAALDYLAQPHDKPQCIWVGLYQPHFPYVAPRELYDYYLKKVSMPDSRLHKNNHHHPAVIHKEQYPEDEKILGARAAYYGMIENVDHMVGQVKEAWDGYLKKFDRKGVFVYMSDHGDQIGEKDQYGKQTFFELSSKIPVIYSGEGVEAGARRKGAVSIMDIGPTLCELGGTTPPPAQDGKSLVSSIRGNEDDENRIVLSEFVETVKGQYVPCRMAKMKSWKLIHYAGYDDYDLLFDLSKDPEERDNVREENPQIYRELKAAVTDGWNVEQVVRTHTLKVKNHDILNQWGRVSGFQETERWEVTDVCKKYPNL